MFIQVFFASHAESLEERLVMAALRAWLVGAVLSMRPVFSLLSLAEILAWHYKAMRALELLPKETGAVMMQQRRIHFLHFWCAPLLAAIGYSRFAEAIPDAALFIAFPVIFFPGVRLLLPVLIALWCTRPIPQLWGLVLVLNLVACVVARPTPLIVLRLLIVARVVVEIY